MHVGAVKHSRSFGVQSQHTDLSTHMYAEIYMYVNIQCVCVYVYIHIYIYIYIYIYIFICTQKASIMNK